MIMKRKLLSENDSWRQAYQNKDVTSEALQQEAGGGSSKHGILFKQQKAVSDVSGRGFICVFC